MSRSGEKGTTSIMFKKNRYILIVLFLLAAWITTGCGENCENVPTDTDDIKRFAPAPCAEDPDADINPDSDVSQVTKINTPDFGRVPDGGEFTGNPAENGEYGVYAEALLIPIAAETRRAAGHTITVEDGFLQGKAYLPQEDGNIVDGQLPLIIVLPGFSASYIFYESYATHFASHGFAVIGVDTRFGLMEITHDAEAVEVSQTISWADSSEDSPLKGRLDMTKIAVSGHSKGGKVAFFAAAIDNRIDIVIGWDPSNSGGPPCFIADFFDDLDCNAQPVAPNCAAGESGIEHYMNAESLVLGVPRDPFLNPDKHHNAIHFYRGAPSPTMLVHFNAGHASALPLEIGGVTIVGHPEVIELNKAVQMSLLLTRFKGMTGNHLDEYLPDTPVGMTNLMSRGIVIRSESK